jgi:hypothetical protein
MLLDGVLPYPDISYRAEVAPWVGVPPYPPAGAARTHGGKTTVYASWNGATQVASWRVLAGNATIATAAKSGFETAIALGRPATTLRLQALDAGGRVLGTSPPFTGG